MCVRVESCKLEQTRCRDKGHRDYGQSEPNSGTNKVLCVDVDRVIVWWKSGEINKGEIVRNKKGKKRKEKKERCC